MGAKKEEEKSVYFRCLN